MLSAEEKQYLCWLTAEQFEGWGAVVDLGPWLGSSSASLAEGLKRRGSDAKIHSIDLFRWEPAYMEPVAPTGLADGADFLPVFERETAAYSAWISPHKKDLTTFSWDGGPIEILFVDAAKSWELTNAIFRGFGPFIVPGKTRVILQDFRYYETHWLPLIFDSRPDLWEEIESVEEGHTVTFLPLKPLNIPAGIQTDYSEDAFPLAAAECLLRKRIAMEEPAQQHWYLRMLYRKYLLDGSYEEAQKMRAALLSEGAISEAEMSKIENLEHILVPRGWKCYDLGDYTTSAEIARQSIHVCPGEQTHALSLLAFSLLQSGDRKAARQNLQQILASNPSSISARLGCAEIAAAEEQFEEAERGVLDVVSGSDCDKIHRLLGAKPCSTRSGKLSARAHRTWQQAAGVARCREGHSRVSGAFGPRTALRRLEPGVAAIRGRCVGGGYGRDRSQAIAGRMARFDGPSARGTRGICGRRSSPSTNSEPAASAGGSHAGRTGERDAAPGRAE